MKFTILLFFSLFIICISSKVIYAQDDKIDSLKFDTGTAEEVKAPYFAVGGGFLGDIFFVSSNIKELNAHLTARNFGNPDLKTQIFMYGGEGFTALPFSFLANWRIGYSGLSGSISSEFTDTVTKAKKGVEYSVGLSAIGIDYGYVAFNHFALVGGLNIGWGNISIETWSNQDTVLWGDILPPGANQKNLIDRANANLILLQPRLNLEYAVAPYLMFRVGASYSISILKADPWLYDRGTTIKKVPVEIRANGFHAQIGVFIGLFNF